MKYSYSSSFPPFFSENWKDGFIKHRSVHRFVFFFDFLCEMSSFIPDNEEDFPQVHTIADEIFEEGFHENVFDVAKDFLPTEFEILEQWIAQNLDGFTLRDLPETIRQIDTLINAVERFSIKCRSLFDGFLSICMKVRLSFF